jgi:hypothetical protein
MPKKTRRPTAGAATGGGKVSAMFEEEEKRIEKKRGQGFMPFRFWLPKGEGCEVVVLDTSLEEGFAIREHNLQGSDGKYGNYERCLADSGAECPVCKKYDSNSYLVLLLTVLVKKEWTSKKTGETHAYSKMLLPIKRGQFAKFRKMEAIAQKNHGTMRGVMFYLERGTDDQSFSIGEPVPLDDGSAFDFYTEEELIDEFGHKAVKNREGKVIKEANEDTLVCDYLKLFPEEDEEEVRDRHGVDPEPGSRADNDAESEEEEADDEIPMAHTPQELGSLADEGDEDAIDQLTELGSKHDLDVNDADAYPDWGTLGEAIAELEKPKPARKRAAKKAAKKAAKGGGRKRTRPKPQADDDGHDGEW